MFCSIAESTLSLGIFQVNDVYATPSQLKCPWPSEMGKVAWGPCKSGELVTCGNHAYAMWHAEGAEHERQPVNNLVNATKWPKFTVGTSLPRWQLVHSKDATAPALAPPEAPAAAACLLDAIPDATVPGLRGGLFSTAAGLVETPTLATRSSAPTLGPSSLRTPGGGVLSAAMLQSPAVMATPAGGAGLPGVVSTPAVGTGSGYNEARRGSRLGTVAASAAGATTTPVLEASTPVGVAGPVSTEVRTEASEDYGRLGVQADKPSQHGLENMFMSITSPARIERPARCDSHAVSFFKCSSALTEGHRGPLHCNSQIM
eukprot:jgi/Ulvmu1/3141/UM015_0181.1